MPFLGPVPRSCSTGTSDLGKMRKKGRIRKRWVREAAANRLLRTGRSRWEVGALGSNHVERDGAAQSVLTGVLVSGPSGSRRPGSFADGFG